MPATALRRVDLSPSVLAGAVSGWILIFDNSAFWRTVWDARDPTSLRAVVAVSLLALVLWALLAAVMRLFPSQLVTPVIACSLLVVSAVLAHFIDTYGVVVDRGMIRSTIQTDWRESGDLLTHRFWFDVGLKGVLPAAAILWLTRPTRASGWRQQLGGALAFTAVAVALALIVGSLFLSDYAAMARNHRELRHLLTPTNAVNGLWGVWKEQGQGHAALTKVGEDARRKPPPVSSNGKPLVVVLAVGETARAANFSLGGYSRATNVPLDRPDVVYFANVESCGTDTATSLPCMFSDLGQAQFSVARAAQRENVLDVLGRAGISTHWIENNTGCKNVCRRVVSSVVQHTPRWCATPPCQDDALVRALRETAAADVDQVVVLHLQGSHGPAYFKRYPGTARRFAPTCDTNVIQSCDLEALRNTYDNSVAFTSDVLALAIDWLSSQSNRIDAVLLFVSDHGESLGENNVYLHGLPRVIAPREQLHVPMLAWISASAADRLGVSVYALRSVAERSYSHDNLFHTLLGVLGVETNAYRADLDVLAIARSLRDQRAPSGGSP